MELLPTPEFPIRSIFTILSLDHAKITTDDCFLRFYSSIILQRIRAKITSVRCRSLKSIKNHQLGLQNIMAEVNLSYHLGSEPSVLHYSPPKLTTDHLRKMGGSGDSFNTNLSKIEDTISGIAKTFMHNHFMSQSENLEFEDKCCCIEPLCLHSEKIFTSDEVHAHKDHLHIALSEMIKRLTVLKCNSRFISDQSQRIAVIFEAMDNIFNEIVEFQAQILQIFTKIKIQTQKHIAQVKKSFAVSHYQQTRNKLITDFNLANLNFALSQIKKYEKFDYPDLDYPHFKVHLVQKRINQLNKTYKDKSLTQLKSLVARYCGDNPEHSRTKKESRSTTTFLSKNVSQQSIFSYYLRSSQYQVSHSGRRLKRIENTTQYPAAFIQKRVDENPIKIKITKSCQQGIVIGYSPLSSLESSSFQNNQNNGYFLHSSGYVLSLKTRYKNAFKYGQNDVVTVRTQKGRLLFNKMRDGAVVEGFSIDLSQMKKSYSSSEKFYVSVMLGSSRAEVQIMQ